MPHDLYTKCEPEREAAPSVPQLAIGSRGGQPVGEEFSTYGRTARLGRLSELVPAIFPLCAEASRGRIVREPVPDKRRGRKAAHPARCLEVRSRPGSTAVRGRRGPKAVPEQVIQPALTTPPVRGPCPPELLQP